MRAKKLLNECKQQLKVESDYALAKALELRPQRVSDYITGRRLPTNFALLQIAMCLKIDAFMLIAEFEALRAQNLDEKQRWLTLVAVNQENKRIHQAQLDMMYLGSRFKG